MRPAVRMGKVVRAYLFADYQNRARLEPRRVACDLRINVAFRSIAWCVGETYQWLGGRMTPGKRTTRQALFTISTHPRRRGVGLGTKNVTWPPNNGTRKTVRSFDDWCWNCKDIGMETISA